MEGVMSRKNKLNKVLLVFFVLIFSFSTFMVGTYGWQSLNQMAQNEAKGKGKTFSVELLKLEKQPGETAEGDEIPLSGSIFNLFTKDGKQIGGSYTTDENGKISVSSLSNGEYYFEEINPTPNYTYDYDDAAGKEIKQYPFTIEGEDAHVTAYNKKMEASLTIENKVINWDNDPYKNYHIQYLYQVTFEDGKDREYYRATVTRAGGSGAKINFQSGDTIEIDDGEKVVFEHLPQGLGYQIIQTQVYDGYVMSSSASSGNVTAAVTEVKFVNEYKPEVIDPNENGVLKVTKMLAGKNGADEYPEADRDKVFDFTLKTTNPEDRTTAEERFSLKAGETKTFDTLPQGTIYEVKEDNYFSEEGGNYSSVIVNGAGTITKDEVTATATNTYMGRLTVDISGEKTWDLGEHEADKEDILPESITVRLMNGELEVDHAVVKADEHGKWKYTFNVPKHSDEGGEIIYTVKEDELADFETEYTAGTYDIVNTFTGTVKTKISGEKIWRYGDYDGDPADVTPSAITVNLKNGDRVVETKTVMPDADGKWLYTFSPEKYDSEGNVIKYTVEEEAIDNFSTSYDGFNIINTYTGTEPTPVEKVTISGEKIWKFGDYSEDASKLMPKSITVYLKNGNKVVKTATVKPDGNGRWKYSFTADKYDSDGELIKYSISEKTIDNFTASYTGYDIINTYDGGDSPKPPTPPKKVTIAGQKTWDFGSYKGDTSELKPDYITVRLLAGGKTIDSKTVKPDSSGNWKYSFTANKYDASGKLIEYTVEEARVDGFTAKYDGYNIKNVYKAGTGKPDDPDNPDKPTKPDKPDNPDKPTKPDNPDKPTKPDKPNGSNGSGGGNKPGQSQSTVQSKTADEANLGIWILLMVISGQAVVIMALRNKAYARRHS